MAFISQEVVVIFVALMYHLVDDLEPPMSVSPGDFRRQLMLLASAGIEVIQASQALALLDEDRKEKRRRVLLTFDDGYKNTTSDVRSQLEKVGFPALMAVNSACLDPETVPPGLPHASLDFANVSEVRGWLSDGHEVAGHGARHRKLRGLGAEELRTEIDDDYDHLADVLGTDIRLFCYPFGASDEASRAAVARRYRASFVTDGGFWPTRAERYRIRRLQVRPEWDVQEFERQLSAALLEANP